MGVVTDATFLYEVGEEIYLDYLNALVNSGESGVVPPEINSVNLCRWDSYSTSAAAPIYELD